MTHLHTLRAWTVITLLTALTAHQAHTYATTAQQGRFLAVVLLATLTLAAALAWGRVQHLTGGTR